MKNKKKGKRRTPNRETSMCKASEAEGPDTFEELEEDDMQADGQMRLDK